MAIGFGIIGCGMISRFHAKAVADIKGAKVTACFDSYTESADKFGKEIGCKVYHKLEDMLADKSVDVVTICTPSGVHAEPAIAVAEHPQRTALEQSAAFVAYQQRFEDGQQYLSSSNPRRAAA